MAFPIQVPPDQQATQRIPTGQGGARPLSKPPVTPRSAPGPRQSGPHGGPAAPPPGEVEQTRPTPPRPPAKPRPSVAKASSPADTQMTSPVQSTTHPKGTPPQHPQDQHPQGGPQGPSQRPPQGGQQRPQGTPNQPQGVQQGPPQGSPQQGHPQGSPQAGPQQAGPQQGRPQQGGPQLAKPAGAPHTKDAGQGAPQQRNPQGGPQQHGGPQVAGTPQHPLGAPQQGDPQQRNLQGAPQQRPQGAPQQQHPQGQRPLATPQRIAPAAPPTDPTPQEAAGGKSQRWRLAVAAAAVVLVAVLATVAVLLVGGSKSSPQDEVRSAIGAYTEGLRTGNLAALRSSTCGSLHDFYAQISEEQFAGVHRSSVENRTIPVVDSVNTISITDDTAIAEATVFTAADPANRTARTFDLQRDDTGWKVCDPAQTAP